MKDIIKSLLFISAAICSCGKEPAPLSNSDLIFSNSLPLKIPSYTFTLGNTEYLVRGDTSFYSVVTDTLPSTPVLKWDSVNVNLIYAGIFDAPIHEENGNITNSGNLIWAWHSGMLKGKNGMVQYNDGKTINSDGTYNNSDPVPLANGITYYWGVWAWNNSGTQIWFSSRPLKFYVKN